MYIRQNVAKTCMFCAFREFRVRVQKANERATTTNRQTLKQNGATKRKENRKWSSKIKYKPNRIRNGFGSKKMRPTAGQSSKVEFDIRPWTRRIRDGGRLACWWWTKEETDQENGILVDQDEKESGKRETLLESIWTRLEMKTFRLWPEQGMWASESNAERWMKGKVNDKRRTTKRRKINGSNGTRKSQREKKRKRKWQSSATEVMRRSAERKSQIIKTPEDGRWWWCIKNKDIWIGEWLEQVYRVDKNRNKKKWERSGPRKRRKIGLTKVNWRMDGKRISIRIIRTRKQRKMNKEESVWLTKI